MSQKLKNVRTVKVDTKDLLFESSDYKDYQLGFALLHYAAYADKYGQPSSEEDWRMYRTSLKKALNKALKEEVPDSMLIMQVHDELIVECNENDKETVSAILKREMEASASLSVPLVAEVGTGSDWLKAK